MRNKKDKKTKKEAYLILHNVRSKHNVGSILRTADASGIGKVFLTGYTPAPVDRFGRKVKEISKSALGAENFVLWEKTKDLNRIIKKLKGEGVVLVAIEQSPNSVNYRKIKIKKPCAFIFGNETSGLSAQLLKRADLIAEIGMRGKKESLNISVAVGIALFQILKI